MSAERIRAPTRGDGLLDARSAPVPDPRAVLTADTVDEAASLVKDAICPHRLHVLVPAGRSLAFLSSLDLGECGLASVRYGFDVKVDAGCIEDSYLVKWTLAGQGHLQSAERRALTSCGSLIITEPTERTLIHMTPQCHHLTIRLSRRALLAALAAKLRRAPRKPLRFDLEIPMDSDFARAWCDLVTHICHVSATAPSALASEDVRRHYSRLLMEIVLTAATHSYSDSLGQRSNRVEAWHVGHARDYIHEHLAENMSIGDIAAQVGVTTRTLQNGFRKRFGLTPGEYIRRARVEALRRALLEADETARVTHLMTNVGIVNFGRYAQYYREQVGVSPSATLREKSTG